MHRTFTLRLRPSKAQCAAFEAILVDSCETYNAALQERRDAWKVCRKRISYEDQTAQLTELRKDPRFAAIAVDIQREPLRRLDRAFRAFCRRVKAGEKPGYPRFRSRHRYDSFTFGRVRIRDGEIHVPSVGWFRFKASQEIIGTPRTATVQRSGKKWRIRLVCDVGQAPSRGPVHSGVGIDLGLSKFITLSDGTSVANPRWTRKHEARVAAANRLLARKQRRSKNRLRAKEVLRRAHQRAADARRNFCHHLSKWLVSEYDLIAFEDLNIRGMVRGNLAKSILDAAWAELIWQLTYKAESAGKWAIPVNPKGTTVRCSQCGADVRKTLRDRRHVCGCGASLDRDHNAAVNILRLGEALRGSDGPSECAPVIGI